MSIYRGYDIEHCMVDGELVWRWVDEVGHQHGPYGTDDQAMDAIDAHKKARTKTA